MISEQGLTYIHKIQQTKTPTTIYEMYTISNRPKRTNTYLRPKYTPKTKILKNSLFYKFSEIYSNIPDHIKSLDIKKYKSQIKIYISTLFYPYSLPSSTNDTDTETDTE